MYEILIELLKDKKGDIIFRCFADWHLLYLAIIIASIVALIVIFKKKSKETQFKLVDTTITIGFVLYMLDFFLMPFAYGEIDIEKLPFHLCTVSCVLCFASNHNKFLTKYKAQLVLLALIGNLIYLIYPAGVGWYKVHPLSYRVIQTLLYHGVMSAYGIFALRFGYVKLEWKKCYKDVIFITILMLWALLGNTLYNGLSSMGQEHKLFNWFFVVRDPFYLLPEGIAKYIMPFVIVLVIFTADMIIYAVYNFAKKINEKKKLI